MYTVLKRPLEENIELLRLTDESVCSKHFHSFLEIAYVCAGEAEHAIGTHEGILKPGDYFIVDYDTPHHYISPQANLTVINCLFLPAFIDSAFANVRSFNELCERYYFKISGRRINGPASNTVFRDDGVIGDLFFKMYTEYVQKQESYLEMLRHLLCQVLIETIRKIGSNDRISPITRQLIQEIDKNYRADLTLQSLCSQIHYSLPYVSSKFRKETGFTFTQYLQNRRIEESCRLLAHTELPVHAVAEQCGYDSLKFFNQVFKEVTRMTPREFRKQKRDF